MRLSWVASYQPFNKHHPVKGKGVPLMSEEEVQDT